MVLGECPATAATHPGMRIKRSARTHDGRELENACCRLEDALKALMHAHDPSFKFRSITINKNLRCKKHKDGGNASEVGWLVS